VYATAVLALAWAFALAAPVQAPVGADAAPELVASQLWRAQNRLGYGPHPATQEAIDAGADARPWARRQIDLAHQASRSAPAIGPELAAFNAPLPSLFAQYRAEREAELAARRTTPPTMANAPGSQPGEAAPERYPFSRAMVQSASAWRLQSCSRPDLENALLARLTEFWFNHLNVFAGKGTVRPFVGHYLVNAIRPHVLGRFEDLLLASAKHPAMLFYLDQAQSVAEGSTGAQGSSRGLNENYARELLELHTLGAQGGYQQADVRQLARILTGWTVDPNDPSGFRFVERQHDRASKTLLGQTIAAEGLREGETAIRMLARHPSTARRVSQRLAEFFVTDQPPPALVHRLAAVFEASQGDLRAVMHQLVDAPEFWAQENRLFKTPMDYACSTLTALGGVREPRDVVVTLGFLTSTGQPMFGWRTPDGYKTDSATWLAPEALTRRTDLALTLGRGIETPAFLQRYLLPARWERIAREAPGLRAGLVLASPEFMYK
jgi:uncharacterized protein (DUF1800 family)